MKANANCPHRTLYWTETAHPACIMRSDLDGRNRAVFLETHMVYPDHLLIDYPTSTLYWVDTQIEVIHRVSLNVPESTRAESVQVRFCMLDLTVWILAHLLQPNLYLLLSLTCLESGRPGVRFLLALGFFWLSHTNNLRIGTLVATLPDAWRYRVSTRTGWPGVSIL